MIRRATIAFFLLACALTLSAQEPASPYSPLRPLPLGDTLLSLPTAHIPGEGVWEVKFTHRFGQSIDDTDWHSLWGLDSNADVSLGLSWVATRDLQFSILRSNVLDDVELAAKYIVVQQAPAIHVSLAVRVGGDIRTEKNLDDRTSAFGQLIVSRDIGRRFEVFAVPTFATNAGRAVTGQTSVALFKHAFNMPVGGAVMFGPAFSVVAELTPVNRDLPDSIDSQVGWAVGFKRAVGGHYFELLVTNSNATIPSSLPR